MLRFPFPFAEDAKANRIAQNHVNERLLELVRCVLIDYACDEIHTIDPDDSDFQDFVADYFPVNYPRKKTGNIFFGLYALLESKDSFVPELAMEYVLAQLIRGMIMICEDAGMTTVEKIEQDRVYVFDTILREKRTEYEDVVEAAEAAISQMSYIEDLKRYDESCFWDCDYELLNSYTEEKLMESGVNDSLGIGLKEERQIFTVPKEWYQK